MSHYGSQPEPDDPREDPERAPGRTSGSARGTHAGEPEPSTYDPYPADWNSAPATKPTIDPAFYAAPAPEFPYGEPVAYSGLPDPANPYEGPNRSRPTFGFGGYAGWFTRVGAYVIDYLCGLVAAAPAIVGQVLYLSTARTTFDARGRSVTHVHHTDLSLALLGIGYLTGLAFTIWNVYLRQGRTGATIGKSVLAIRLVNADLQPIGAGWSFLRQILHIVDALPCMLGFVWPIWDSRKQTFADKIMGTFVIQATTPQQPYPPQPYPPPPYGPPYR
jgi:uncharacterized RDD family membrane protein YckC